MVMFKRTIGKGVSIWNPGLRYGSPLEYQLLGRTVAPNRNGSGIAEEVIDGASKLGKFISNAFRDSSKYAPYTGPTSEGAPQVSSNTILGLRRLAKEQGLTDEEFKEVVKELPKMAGLAGRTSPPPVLGEGLFLPGGRFVGKGMFLYRRSGGGWFDSLMSGVSSVVNYFKEPAKKIFSYAQDLLPTAMDAYRDVKDIFTGDKSFTERIGQTIGTAFKYLPKALETGRFIKDRINDFTQPRRPVAEIVKNERSRKLLENANRKVDTYITAEDVIRRKQMEARLAQAQRIEGRQLAQLGDYAERQVQPAYTKNTLRSRLPPALEPEPEDDMDDEYYGSGLVKKLLRKKAGKLVRNVRGRGFQRV